MKNNLKMLAGLLAVIMAFSTVFASCENNKSEDSNGGTESLTQDVTKGTVETDASDGNEDETKAPQSNESSAPESDESSAPESDESSAPESDESSAPESDESGAPESDESSAPESDESGAPESDESNATESDESSAPESSDTDSSETQPPQETDDTRFEKEYAPVLYMDPKFIADATKKFEWGDNGSNMLGGYLSDDKSYVTLIPFDGERESMFYLFEERRNVGPVIAIKYRTRHTGIYMEFFMNSFGERAQSGSNFKVRGLRTDGEWDVKIIDVRDKLYEDIFNGEFVNYIRFDFANGDPIPPECEIDVEYVAFFNSVEDAGKFEYGEDYVVPNEGGVGDENATLFFDAIDIDSAADENENKNLDVAILSEGLDFITLKPKAGNGPDGYINLLLTKKKAARYFAIKYRTEDLGYWIEVFTDSVNKGATAGSSFTFYPINDGEWHVFVIDLEEHLGSRFNGEYVNYIRFDFMNCNDKFGDWSMDVEYIGFYADPTHAKGKDYDPNAPVNIFTAEDIKTAVDNKNTDVGSATLAEDGSFVTVEAKEGAVNAYAYIFTSKREAARYMVVKYRTEASGFYMQLWMNSGAYTAGGAKITVEGFPRDGKWQYGVYDLYEALPEGQFNDQYLAHFRFDFIHRNGDLPAPAGVTLDVGYFAFFDSLEAAEAYVEAGRELDGEDPEGGENVGGDPEGDETEGDETDTGTDTDTDINTETDTEPEAETFADAFFNAEEIASAANASGNKNIADVLISENGQFVTIRVKEGGNDDAYIKLLNATAGASDYFAIKYRTNDGGYWTEFFMDSVNATATGGSNFNFYPTADGEWHIYVVNVAETLGSEKFNGEVVNYIRFDVMNKATLGNWYMDVAGMGFFTSEEAAIEALSGEITDKGEIRMEPTNIFEADDIKEIIDKKNTNVDSAEVSSDGSYVTVKPAVGVTEATAYFFDTETRAGRYMVIKYKTQKSGFYMQVYANSNDHNAGNGVINIEGINADGEWQYGVFDLNAKLGSDLFNGSTLMHLRFDFINMSGSAKTDTNTFVDIAYVAFFDSLEAAEAYKANN